jgi:hypothetical protein
MGGGVGAGSKERERKRKSDKQTVGDRASEKENRGCKVVEGGSERETQR